MVTVKLPAVPTVKVVEAAEVIAGASSTTSVKLWVPFGLTPLLAVMVIGYPDLPVPAAGVPDNVAVPLPLSWKVTPEGKVPDSERLGVGYPEVVTVKLPAVPTVKVVELAEVMVGAWLTVKVVEVAMTNPSVVSLACKV